MCTFLTERDYHYLRQSATVREKPQRSGQEERKSDPLQQFFPERHYVPLTEVLATVNQHCGFLDELQHWQQQHIRSSISHRSLYAGVIGLGCGIGTRKMGRIISGY